MDEESIGIPASVAGKLAKLDIKRPSSWRVLITIIGEATASGNDAHLRISDIAGATNLCERTVKTAVAELVAAGIIVRVGRVGRFSVPMLRGPGLSNLRRGKSFTARQESAVKKALREAGLLLSVDPGSIAMPPQDCEMVGLQAGITFSRAFEIIRAVGDRDRARRFVGMVLEFRYCEWVGGRPAL